MKITAYTPALFTAMGLTLATAVPARAQDAPQSIRIQQSLPAGKALTQSTTINNTMGLQNMKMGMSMNMVSEMAIHAAEEGKKRAVMKYTSAKMAMDMGGAKMEYDSEGDQPSPFSELIGKEVTVLFNADGSIESIEGADDLLGDVEPGAAAQLKQIFDKAQIKNTLEQSMLQNVPDKELKVDDSWNFEKEVPLPQGMGNLTMKGAYTLQGFEKLDGIDCAVIHLKGTLDGNIEGGADAQGVSVKLEDAAYEGTIHFDNALGMPRKSDVVIDMVMMMGGLGAEAIKADVQQKIVNEITKVEDLEK